MSEVQEIGKRARRAATRLATASSSTRDGALRRMASALVERTDEIVQENAHDLERGEQQGITRALADRLALNASRIKAMAEGLLAVASLRDPVGEVVSGWTLPNELRIEKRRVPIGVVGIIYEARPNVTVDAAGLCVKSANAVILRGSSTALSSNLILARVLDEAGQVSGLPPDAVQLIPMATRESAVELMRMRDYVDVLIPRGGADLIRTVVEQSTVPVIETGVGNCHVYIDAEANLEKALEILINSKAQRPAVCNAAESFLVHRAVADKFVPRALSGLSEKGVEIVGDDEIRKFSPDIASATEEDWRAEYLDLKIAAKVVDSLDDAIEHINTYGTQHTEAIITEDLSAARRFVQEVDAAVVMVNASTRFTDGGEFGFGAEIGISTQKLHARGPMALPELTTYKYVVWGDGQIRT